MKKVQSKKLQKLKKNNSYKYIIWFIVILVFGGLMYQLIDTNKEIRSGQSIAIQSAEHISADAPKPDYNSNPPTSGPHAAAVYGGFYDKELKDRNVVHNLEHGFIWISYKNVNEVTLAALKKIGDQFPASVVISQRLANDFPISLASWGQLENLKTFDEAKILKFIHTNKNKSPERMAR